MLVLYVVEGTSLLVCMVYVRRGSAMLVKFVYILMDVEFWTMEV